MKVVFVLDTVLDQQSMMEVNAFAINQFIPEIVNVKEVLTMVQVVVKVMIAAVGFLDVIALLIPKQGNIKKVVNLSNQINNITPRAKNTGSFISIFYPKSIKGHFFW